MLFENIDNFIDEIKERLHRENDSVTTSNALAYCPRCLKERRMQLHFTSPGTLARDLAAIKLNPGATPSRKERPGLFHAICVHCGLVSALLVTMTPEGPLLAVFPTSDGGLATPNTPPEVAHFA